MHYCNRNVLIHNFTYYQVNNEKKFQIIQNQLIKVFIKLNIIFQKLITFKDVLCIENPNGMTLFIQG